MFVFTGIIYGLEVNKTIEQTQVNVISDVNVASLTNGIKRTMSELSRKLCLEAAHKLINEPTCSSQLAFICEKPEIFLKSKYEYYYIRTP